MALIKVNRDDVWIITPLGEVADPQERERLLWRKLGHVPRVLINDVGEALEMIDDLVEGGAVERFGCASIEIFVEKYLELWPEALDQLGLTYKQSAAYQELASVEEDVILDAIAAAGAEGREVTKRDIRRAVRETLGKRKASRPQICRRRMLCGLSCARQTASEP
jgi:hypothetical protein